jgi:nicotinamidase/pyrazinamidase
MAEALLIIDFQNDFTPPEGALAVPEGDEIADRLNELAASDRFDLVVATRDWHPPDHSQFEEQGGVWPVHCVQGTSGAELHPSLDRDKLDVVIEKGENPDEDGYSGFEDTELAELLREHGIDAVTIVGLAADVCVKNTALDAAREGLEVTVDSQGTRGVNLEPGDTERAFEEMRQAGATIA